MAALPLMATDQKSRKQRLRRIGGGGGIGIAVFHFLQKKIYPRWHH